MINLDSDKDKWSSFSEFKEFERFSALDSREKPFMYRDYGFELAPTDELFKYTIEYFSQSKGAVGCYFSHYKIWQEIIKEKYDWCLVLEDDVCPESLDLFFKVGIGDIKNTDLKQFLTEKKAGFFGYIRNTFTTTRSKEYAKVEVAPKFEGKQIMMILVPQVAK